MNIFNIKMDRFFLAFFKKKTEKNLQIWKFLTNSWQILDSFLTNSWQIFDKLLTNPSKKTRATGKIFNKIFHFHFSFFIKKKKIDKIWQLEKIFNIKDLIFTFLYWNIWQILPPKILKKTRATIAHFYLSSFSILAISSTKIYKKFC